MRASYFPPHPHHPRISKRGNEREREREPEHLINTIYLLKILFTTCFLCSKKKMVALQAGGGDDD